MQKLIFIFLQFCAVLCAGQSTSIHFDKPYYFAGEYIFFSWCNSNLSTDTISAHIELFQEQNALESYFLPTVNQCGDGYFKLSHDVPSGNYQFTVSVYESDNFQKIIIGTAWLSVYNVEDANAVSRISPELNTAEAANVENSISPLVQLGTRNQGEIHIALPIDLAGKVNRVSVAVRDSELFAAHENTVFVHQTQAVNEPMRGIPFLGSRTLINSGTIKNHLLFAFNSGDMVFDGAGVDLATERFNLELHPFFDERIVTFIDYLGGQIEIERRFPEMGLGASPVLEMDSSIRHHLRIFREEKQINSIFQQMSLQLQTDSIHNVGESVRPNFFVDVQDYDIRGTTVDLFKELSTSLKFRSIGNGEHEAKLLYERNGLTKFYTRPPLFIVNSKATYDGVFMAKIPLQEIKYISIYQDYDFLQSLSPLALGGLVYVEMMDPNYALPADQALPAMSIRGMQAPVQYPVTPRFIEGHPVVGSLLYWNPSVPVQGNEITLEIPTHDIKSNFLIEAVLHLQDGTSKKITQLLKVGI